MKKVYFLSLLCFLSFAALSQTTVTIYSTGAGGSFITGNSTNTTRADGNIVTTAATRRGYAVFDLSSIPAGAVISSTVIGFNVATFTGAGAASGWNTRGFAGDLSTVTTAATLFADMASGTSLSTATYGAAAGNRTLASTAAANTFVQGQIGNLVSICWTGGNTRTYTITGETGTTTTTGTHAPYLQITYCAPPTGVTATAAPTPLCVGGTLNLTGTATGATAFSWTGPGFTATTQNTTNIVTLGSGGVYTFTATNVCGATSASVTATTGSVTVDAAPDVITGGPNVCTGRTTILTDATTGGTWSSSTASVATINSTSGTVGGVGAGTTTITYSLGTGCSMTAVINDFDPPANITGSTGIICVGTSVTLADGTTGGAWTSSNPAVATVTTTGTVTALGGGSTTIAYTLPSGCSATANIIVNPASAPAPITGTFSECVGSNTTLHDASGGGNWSSSATGIALALNTGVVYGESAGTATISYTSAATGCYTTAVMTVVAAPAAITGTRSVCVGSTSTLVETSTGGTWSSTNLAVATIDPTGVVSGVALGTSTISYILPPGCATAVQVTVNPLPAVIGGPTVVCTGGTATLTDGTTGGTWTSSNLGIATIGLTTGIVSGVAPGGTIITYTAPTGCTATAVINDADPPAAITGGAVGICLGSTVALADVTTGGTWTSSSNAIATVDGTGLVTSVSAGAVNISYVVSNSCAATTPVTVNPLPAAIGGNANVCTGVVSTLTDATTGGTWASSDNTIATIDPATGAVTGVLAGTATITYTLGTGCTTTLTITDSDPPAAITGGAVAICAGTTVTLGETSTGGTWSSSTLTIATVDPTGVVTGVGGGVDNILYTLASGCFASTPVTVNPLPAAIAGNANICTGNTTTLTDATTGGTWTSSDNTVATVDPTTGVVTGVIGGTATITYTLGTGCLITFLVTDTDPPGTVTIGAPVICQGNTTTATEVTTGGTWSSSNISVATVDATTGIVSGADGGVANISYILPTGCFAIASVTVNPLPTAIIGAISVCTGSTTVLTEGTTGGTWGTSDPTIASIDNTGTVFGMGSGVATISYTLGTGCFITSTMTDNDPPVAIGGSTTVCAGSTTPLSDGTTGGTWSSSDPAVATIDMTTGVVSGVAAGTTNISYIMATGCFITMTMTVNPLPQPITGPNSVCTGSTVLLSDISGSGVWSTSAGGTASIDASGTVYGISAGTATISYTFTVTSCFVTMTMTDTDPPSAIVGPSAVCEQATISLNDFTFGGTWVSSDISRATVDGSGIVTGVSAGTTTISYILSATGCFITTPITVNPIPSAIIGATAVCSGLTTDLTDATTGGAWATSAGGIASVDAVSGTVFGISTGTATISYVLPVTGCFVTLTMTDNDPPTPIVGSSLLCVGSTFTFTDAVAGGLWSSFLPGIASANAVTGDIFGEVPGTDTIYYTVVACPVVSFPVTVNPAPTAITGPTSVCVGDSILLVNGTPGGFWGSSNPGFALVSPTGEVYGQASGVLDINYTTGGCTPVSYTITVNPTPTIIGGITHVCATFTSVLTDGVTGGQWSSSDNSIASVDLLSGDVLGVSEGVVTITYTLPAGCFKTTLFTVNPLPAAITFPTAVVCQGSTILFSDATTGGIWTTGITSIATIGTSSGLITGGSAGTTNVLYTLPTGCFMQAFVTVNPLPIPSVGPTSVCVNSTITLTNSSPGGPGSWSSSNTAAATAGLTTGIVTGVATGTTSIIFSLPTGCNTSTTVTVNPVPAAIFGLSSVCVGSSIILTDITPGGTWNTTSTSAGVTPGGVVSGASAGVASISYTLSATGCSAVSAITVNPLPAPITGSVFGCTGATQIVSDTDPGGTWSSSSAVTATVGTSSGIVTGVATGFTTIVYTLPTGCSTGLGLTIEPTPVAAITSSGPTTFCSGGNVILSGTAGVYTYQWFDTGTAITGAIGSSYTASVTGSYSVKITSSFGCSDSSAATAVSNGIFPVLTFTGSDTLCAGNNILLTTDIGGAVGAVTYVWMNGTVVIPGASDLSYDVTGTGMYFSVVSISGASGFCTVNSDSINITVHPLPVPPLTFDGTTLSTTPGYAGYQWFLNTVGIPGANSNTYSPLTDGSYRVLVIDSFGCDGYSISYAYASEGVKNLNGADVRIYPNPATSVVHIESTVAVRAVITSMDGKTLLDQTNAKDINISNLSDGLYLIMIYDQNGNQLLLEKLVKE